MTGTRHPGEWFKRILAASRKMLTRRRSKRHTEIVAVPLPLVHVDVPMASSKPTADSQSLAPLKTIVTNGPIPVDDYFEFKTSHKVYCERGVAYDFLVVRADVEPSRHYYRIGQVLQPESEHGQWVTISRYGRIGDEGIKTRYFWPDKKEAIDAFDRLFKLWTGVRWGNRELVRRYSKDRYTYITRTYPTLPAHPAQDATQEPRCDKRVQQLARLIFADTVSSLIFKDAQQLFEMTHDTGLLPLGPLSIETLDRGSKVLSQIDDLLNEDSEQKSGLAKFSSHYFTLIPHAFPHRAAVPIIDSRLMVEQERQLLHNIRAAQVTYRFEPRAVSHTDPYQQCKLDRLVGSLALKVLEPVDKCSAEYKKIEECCVTTQGSLEHPFTVADIIRVEREGEAESFKECCEGLPDNRWLLWHGSTHKNFAGILSKGLRAKDKPAGECEGFDGAKELER